MTSDPDNFLGLDPEHCDPVTARYAVLPVPYEGTVTYASGTAAGPAAIINASQQVELFDQQFHRECHRAGIATYPPVEPADDPAEQMRRVRDAAEPIMQAGTFLLTLGGEHSIAAPLVQLAQEMFGPISVLQIDAHADLRNTYDGTPFSHACVMRRVLESTDRICQVGIRSFSKEEYEACGRQVAAFITPDIIHNDPNWINRALARLGETVYVTIDIDGLDPSIAPGTGTPEPGGLLWQQTIDLLQRVARERQIVAADIVEVRPIPPDHTTEFLAARLAYKLIAATQM
ncbi:MAG: agmatinase [Planctomycetota bacterium]|jgi:agmatinase